MRIHENFLIAFFCATGGIAQAATIVPGLTKTEVSIDGAIVSDSGLPTSFSSSNIATADYAASVTAFQNETGFSQISLDISSHGGTAADAILGHSLSAETFLVLDFLNDGTEMEDVVFNFSLSGMLLRTINAGSNLSPTSELIFTAVQSSGGDAIFSADAKLVGNYGAPQITTNGFSGTLTEFECLPSGTCYGADYQINNLSGSLDLGLVAPGEKTEVTVILGGYSMFGGFETGGEVFATDPSGWLSYSVSSTPSATISAVPLPAGLPLAFTGLVTLGLLRRRRS